ncbi:NAD(P)/FAD-dependent oxidoreductase [Cellulomonas oligotrophica]|uniref:FAD-dependent oxidoreductase n=1 Tax=Cellulomonas oligotrophica TaxID=931536 RepID=A0A7Y9FJ78_9CELL|nr:FAD-dependent oxidoreductase [Cellulomonas oligotrophica]NYD88138.1 glycine/D-amino acid oxidase-like deaminating enzyme [Cellulomonas oligotrophica]GIG33646.1 FAD-dependent oxidoreductase [Cellulomonas oligotrophica]
MSAAARVDDATHLRGLSLWWDQVVAEDPGAATPRPPLDGDTTADVVVVGGGYTGLWTAYYLLEADPSLDVLVVEQDVAGSGASGRNGGWCSALFPTSPDALARRHGPDAAREMRAAMRDTVVEVGGVAAAEQIGCDFAYGGTVTLARTAPQVDRVTREAAEGARWGDEVQLLDPEGVAEHVRAEGVLAGTWTPDCARVQPARLAHGLAQVLTARGVRIAERTRALRTSPRAVVTDQGTVRCRWVVRATEAWTPRLPGSARDVVPVYSLMVATEPLPASVWATIGLDRGQTLTDARHLVVYGQRTADDRLAFGGRGAPYHPGSAVDARYDQVPRVHAHLHRTLVELFPAVADHAVTHTWGGALGVPRDWHASVGLDPSTGIGWAGGYVGDGVGTANLAGRTLADLITGADTPLTRLPWVGHRSPAWEPEPVRWAEITAARWAATWADAAERRTGRPSLVARALSPFLGH